jgi:hypothetical protein
VESITLDEWQHVAVTYDGVSDVRMWIDGAEQTVTSTAAPSGNLGVNGAVTIGNTSGLFNRAFEGCLDEVRLWSVARSDSDIIGTKDSLLSGYEAGLVGYWAMDEGNGSSVADGSPAGGDGSITGAHWEQGVILNATGVQGTGDDDQWGNKSLRIAASPNPFSRATELAMTLPSPSTVRVTVHDLSGRVVRVIDDRRLEAGTHSFDWDGRNSEGLPVAAGVYFCRAATEAGTAAGKIVLLR